MPWVLHTLATRKINKNFTHTSHDFLADFLGDERVQTPSDAPMEQRGTSKAIIGVACAPLGFEKISSELRRRAGVPAGVLSCVVYGIPVCTEI